MPGQLSNAVKEDRSRRAIAVAGEMSVQFRKQMLGTVAEVLFEEAEQAYFTGHSANYIKVYVKAEDLHNCVKQVKLTALHEDGMLGELV